MFALTFRSVIYLELILVYGVRSKFSSFPGYAVIPKTKAKQKLPVKKMFTSDIYFTIVLGDSDYYIS